MPQVSNIAKSIDVYSFFSGIGLLDLGFENAGFNIEFVSDIKGSFLHGYQYARKCMKLSAPKYGYWKASIDEALDNRVENSLKDALYELIKNSYDVGARNVFIRFKGFKLIVHPDDGTWDKLKKDSPTTKTLCSDPNSLIEIQDVGSGMTDEEILDNWLQIGTAVNEYIDEIDYVVSNGMLLFSWSGSKGSFFGPHILSWTKAILKQYTYIVHHDHRLIKNFLYIALKNAVFEEENNLHGGVGIVHIKKCDLGNICNSLPSIDEQQKTVEIVERFLLDCAIIEKTLHEKQYHTTIINTAVVNKLVNPEYMLKEL